MAWKMHVICVSVLLLLCCVSTSAKNKEALNFLREFNKEAAIQKYIEYETDWQYRTNVTEETTKRVAEARSAWQDWLAEQKAKAKKINLKGISPLEARQFKLLTATPPVAKSKKIANETAKLKIELSNTFNLGSFPMNPKIVTNPKVNRTAKTLTLADVRKIQGNSTNEKELLYVWEGWRHAVGFNKTKLYSDIVALENIAGKDNNLNNYWEHHTKTMYETDNLENMVDNIWKKMEPFYQEMHAYVRFRLKEFYPDLIKDNEPIPDHIMGTDWGFVSKLIVPYPGAASLDIKSLLTKNNYTVKQMYQGAEKSFMSLGWRKLPDNFWKKSLLEKPKDKTRKVQCHGTAWDMRISTDGSEDVRILMCTSLGMLHAVYHEMGHVYSFLFYRPQPYVFQDTANPAFTEAVGNVLAISAVTPSHLKDLGLLKAVKNSKHSKINFLLKEAMNQLPALPLTLAYDKWRWKVYRGEIKREEYNLKFWKLVEEIVGLKSPVDRSSEDLDVMRVIHTAYGVPLIRYFIANTVQYDFHKALCVEAGHKGPLDECNIFNSKKAGTKFRDILKIGRQKPWPENLKMLTGSEDVRAGPMLEYFEPLYKWLKEQREKHGYKKGWKLSKNPLKPDGAAKRQF